ncbi:MAG: hypothetical protein OEZ10_04465 [Gammaproteobacteria bacterium]|nr:hypothetical protein [Gammaproteobacteria bacterium]
MVGRLQRRGRINIAVYGYIDARFTGCTVSIQENRQPDIEFFEGDFIDVTAWR